MSYRILLVDDEPLILSGIKFLIDWEKQDCQIAGTARNGRRALEMIGQLHPDIVICDINMPSFSGIEVLRALADDKESPVFIMLTNHEDFDLARQALRYKAVDYLIKSQLEAEALERSLGLAKEEQKRRGRLAKVQLAESYLESNKTQLIMENAKLLLISPCSPVPTDCSKTMELQGTTQHFCYLQLMLDFSALPNIGTFTEQDRIRLYSWEKEVVEKLSGNLFTGFTAFDPDGFRQSVVLYCWDVPENHSSLLERFYAKLCTASENITQTRLSLMGTQVLQGSDQLGEAVRQLLELRAYYYLTQCNYILYESLPCLDLQPIVFEELGNKLVAALRARSAPQCALLLDQAAETMSGTPHRHADALNACATLYSVASMVINSIFSEDEAGDFFTGSVTILQQIRGFTTRTMALGFLEQLKKHIVLLLEQMAGGKSNVAEKAKQYIQENVDKRIMLQDVAKEVNLSPGYLSALFKKEYNQNLVDYINAAKMEQACALIREGKYRIYEISLMLSFENAYYFAKVFKKHTGLTPTEYQRKIQKEK